MSVNKYVQQGAGQSNMKVDDTTDLSHKKYTNIQ